jgi:hypothetical protein
VHYNAVFGEEKRRKLGNLGFGERDCYSVVISVGSYNVVNGCGWAIDERPNVLPSAVRHLPVASVGFETWYSAKSFISIHIARDRCKSFISNT